MSWIAIYSIGGKSPLYDSIPFVARITGGTVARRAESWTSLTTAETCNPVIAIGCNIQPVSNDYMAFLDAKFARWVASNAEDKLLAGARVRFLSVVYFPCVWFYLHDYL
jgi:hypothetical protein